MNILLSGKILVIYAKVYFSLFNANNGACHLQMYNQKHPLLALDTNSTRAAVN